MFQVIALFCLIFVWHTPRVFFGIDISDAGFILMNQTDLISKGQIKAIGMTLLSDLAGGAWLALYDKPSLLWARFGGVLIDCCSSILAYLILKKYFPSKQTFWAVLVSSMLIVSVKRYETLIHYYSFPVFISLIMLLIFDKGLNGCKDSRKQKLCSILFGVLWVVLFMARFPYIVLILLPLILFPLWDSGLIIERNKAPNFMLRWYGGAFVATIIAWFIMKKAGVWDQYILSLIPNYNSDPFSVWSIANPRVTLTQQAARFIKSTIVLVIWIGTVVFFFRFAAQIPKLLRFVFLLIAFLLLLFFKSNGPMQGLMRFREILFVGSVLGITFPAFRERSENPLLSRLLFLGFVLLLPLPIGSSVGFTGAVYGLWFALPATYLGFLKVIQNEENLSFGGVIALKSYILPVIFIVALIIHVTPHENSWNSKSFIPKQITLKGRFGSTGLKGIFDEQQKVKEIDQVLDILNKQMVQGNVGLFYNHIALLPWLAKSHNLLDSPVLYHSFEIPIIDIVKRSINEKGLPKTVVLNEMYEQSSHLWRETESLRLYFNKEMGYKEVLKNNMFAVYLRAK